MLLLAMGAISSRAHAHGVPVYCSAAVSAGVKQTLLCRRGDTGAFATPVPAGQMLFVTDIVAEPNTSATTGTFSATLGRETPAAAPAPPSVDLIGNPGVAIRYRTPYVVLHAGESLVMTNSAGSNFPVDVRVTAILAATFKPQEEAVFRSGFERE